MKKNVTILILITLFFSCKKNDELSFVSEKEILNSVLVRFQMIDKNLKSVRKIDLDSVSINLLRNPGKEAYDQVLVLKKRINFMLFHFSQICMLITGIFKSN